MFSRVLIVCIIFCSMIVNMDAALSVTRAEYEQHGGSKICTNINLDGLCINNFGAGCTGKCEVWDIRFTHGNMMKEKILLCRKSGVIQGCLYTYDGNVRKTDYSNEECT